VSENRSLTPTEARVGRLVAAGRTNREAAAFLGLSPKTIEWHLSRIYRKAGVRSRTELALRLIGTSEVRGNPLGRATLEDELKGPLRLDRRRGLMSGEEGVPLDRRASVSEGESRSPRAKNKKRAS
jgi:DNA-binding CsgD family transcriptional regulator